MTNDTNFRVAAYNLDNNRNPGQVEKEIRAIAGLGDDVLCFCEAFYDMPGLEGYVLFRDTSRKSRTNIATYCRAEYPIDRDRCRWLDLSETWTRTNPGASGQHEPRSYYELVIGSGVQVINVHQPPKGTDNVKRSQQEGIDKLAGRMTPGGDGQDRPRVAVGDFNRRPDEDGPGPFELAQRIDGYTTGAKIDCAVRRKMGVQQVSYPTSAGGVQLKSDHGHMARFVLRLDGSWLHT